MRKRARLIVVVSIAGLALLAGGIFAWRQPAVRDLWLSRSDLSSLADRVAADPTDWHAQYWYGKRSAEAGDLEHAESSLRICLGSHPDFEPGLIELGKVLLASNRIEESFQVLKMATGREPRNAAAHTALATLYRSQGALQRAMEEATEALSDHPNDQDALFERAAAEDLAQLTDKAEADLRQVLRLSPNNIPALIGLSQILAKRSQWDDAEALARKADRLKPANPSTMIALARVVSRKEPLEAHREEALALLQRARALAPSHSDATWEIAQILSAAGRWPEALSELETVVRTNPDRTQAFFLLARAYRATGRPDLAKKAEAVFREKDTYDRAVQSVALQISTHPDDPRLRYREGELHARTGHLHLAIRAYKGGLERDPNNETARKRLSELIQQNMRR